MILQDVLDQINANIFYREFSFSSNNFFPSPGQSEEFADHAIWIDDLLIVYQLKQRTTENSSDKSDRNWFKKEVLSKATSQVRNTLRFLQEYPDINISNQKGHIFNVSAIKLKHIIKLIVYSPNEGFPKDLLRVRHHISRTAGFIHIIPWLDYAGICATLLTPAELVEYFEYREMMIKRWESTNQLSSEPALLGQFLRGDDNSVPSEEYIKPLKVLKRDSQDFDITPFLSDFGNKIIGQQGGTSELDYYKTLAEFAKLRRGDLKQVKWRMQLCLNAARENKFFPPNRIIVPDTGCGFMFIAFDKMSPEARRNIFGNLTMAAKYEQHLNRQIGVSFSKDNSFIDVEWCYLDYPWKPDPWFEERLRDHNPFGPLRSEVRPRYSFNEE